MPDPGSDELIARWRGRPRSRLRIPGGNAATRAGEVRLCAARGGRIRLTVANTRPSSAFVIWLWATVVRWPLATGHPRAAAVPGCVLAPNPFLESLNDPPLSQFVLPGEAFGIDAQQHVYAVPRPLGYLGGCDTAVESRRQAGVPAVVRPPCERRRLLLRG